MQRDLGDTISGEVGGERGTSGGSEEAVVRTEPERKLSGGRKYLSQRCVWCGEFHIEECAAEMEINRWRNKYIMMRRYVREANRGAHRNALAAELAIHRGMKKANDASEWYGKYLKEAELVKSLKKQVVTLGEALAPYNVAHLSNDEVNDCDGTISGCGGCRACY